MMPSASDWTPTEKRILDLLGDGTAHAAEELHGCLWDDMAKTQTIQFHLSNIRKRLRPVGRDVVCVRNGKGSKYQLMRCINKDD